MMPDIEFKNRRDEIENAIQILRGVLSYHERMCAVADLESNSMLDIKDFYRHGLRTALAVLEDERKREINRQS